MALTETEMHKPSFASAEVFVEELLPGISNDITLDLIVPKLSWRHFHILSSVSRTWQHAIQSHAVYDARVQSRSTETLAVVGNRRMHGRTNNRTIALYSTRDKTLSELPPIPDLDGGDGRPPYCKCVSSHGRLYVLGGERFPSGGHFSPSSNVYMLDRDGKTVEVLEPYPSSEVYVLDLAGQRQWRRCADMNHCRVLFGSASIHGKIYVFGGRSRTGYLGSGEVFDPKVNAWSPITPMPSFRVCHEVSVIGEELLMYGGYTHGLVPTEERRANRRVFGTTGSTEIYNPIKDEWRLNGPSDVIESPRALAAQGKLHLSDEFDRTVRDIAKSRFDDRQPPLTFSVDFDAVNSPHLMTTIQL